MPSANFVLSERSVDQRTLLLSLEGDTTAAAGGRTRQRLAQLGEKKLPLVIVDLSRVTSCDSAVLRARAEGAGELKRSNTRLVMFEPVDPMIARPLELGRLDLV